MKSLLVLLAIVLLSMGGAACGEGAGSASQVSSSASSGAPAVTSSIRGHVRGDDDADGDGYNYEDDHSVRDYGHAASAADVQAVTAAVKRYYAAAVAGDGATACSLVYSGLAKRSNFSEVVPGAYATASNSSVFRGKTCAQVASLLFELNHQRLTEDVATLEVTGVRVSGAHGLALLAFRRTPERQIAVEHEGGAWKIDGLLDEELP
jgi:hypothetical protein